MRCTLGKSILMLGVCACAFAQSGGIHLETHPRVMVNLPDGVGSNTVTIWYGLTGQHGGTTGPVDDYQIFIIDLQKSHVADFQKKFAVRQKLVIITVIAITIVAFLIVTLSSELLKGVGR